MGKYDSIRNQERPLDSRHPIMPLHKRAAQFAPFDALTGFYRKIYEESRLTEPRIILSEERKQVIDEQIRQIKSSINERPLLTVTYFLPDKTKDGGSYQTITASAEKIDTCNERLLLEGDTTIAFDDIMDITICSSP